MSLSEISGKLDKIIGLLELMVEEPEAPKMPKLPNPILPAAPLQPRCPSCNMDFSGAMGYVCGNIECPMGAGPVT